MASDNYSTYSESSNEKRPLLSNVSQSNNMETLYKSQYPEFARKKSMNFISNNNKVKDNQYSKTYIEQRPEYGKKSKVKMNLNIKKVPKIHQDNINKAKSKSTYSAKKVQGVNKKTNKKIKKSKNKKKSKGQDKKGVKLSRSVELMNKLMREHGDSDGNENAPVEDLEDMEDGELQSKSLDIYGVVGLIVVTVCVVIGSLIYC